MIITCPECKTRYKTSADAIGVNGRTVRCAACTATWFVAAPDADFRFDDFALEDNERAHMESANAIKAVVPSPSEPAAKEKTQEVTPKQVEEAAPPAPEKHVPEVYKEPETHANENEPVVSSRGAHVDIRERADKKRRKQRLRGVAAIWALPVLFIGLLAATAYTARHSVVSKYPKTATLYKAIGVQVSQLGLVLTPPETRYAEVDGRPVLVITGAVKNISQKAQPVSMIALSLHNSGDDNIAEWIVELETESLASGERAEFLSQFPNPPLDAVTLKSRFVDDSAIEATLAEVSEETLIETPIELQPNDVDE